MQAMKDDHGGQFHSGSNFARTHVVVFTYSCVLYASMKL